MTPSGLDIQVHPPNLISLTGELDVATAPRLRAAIENLHADDPGTGALHIDAAGISFCDSTGIGTLIWAHTTYAGNGTDIVVVNPSAILQRLILLTGLQDILPTASSPDSMAKRDSRPRGTD